MRLPGIFLWKFPGWGWSPIAMLKEPIVGLGTKLKEVYIVSSPDYPRSAKGTRTEELGTGNIKPHLHVAFEPVWKPVQSKPASCKRTNAIYKPAYVNHLRDVV